MSTQSKLLLSKIINYAVKSGATRIHFEAGSRPVMRIDQKLTPLQNADIITADFLQDMSKILLTEDQLKQLQLDKSFITTHTFEGRIRFKIHIFYQKNNLSFIFTYIPSVISSPSAVGLTMQFIELLKQKSGLMVVSGFEGAGRTTTVLSLLNHINTTQNKYILTLEKPIEYILTSQKSTIEQQEVGRDVPDYLKGIDFIHDSDADIVFISEVENYQVLQGIFRLINEGRLVIVIVSAASVPATVNYLVNLSPQSEVEKTKEFLSQHLLGIAVQQLVPRRGGGQVNISEILIVNPAAASLIKNGNYSQLISVMQTSHEEGMQSLDQVLLELLKTGEVEFNDAYQLAVNKEDFLASAKQFSLIKK